MKRTWELVAVPAVNELVRRLYIDDEAVESDAEEDSEDEVSSLHEDAPEPDYTDAPIDGFDRRSSSSLSSCSGGLQFATEEDACDSDVARVTDRILDPSRFDPEWRSEEEDGNDSLDGFLVADDEEEEVYTKTKTKRRKEKRNLFSDDNETTIMTPLEEPTTFSHAHLPTLEEFLEYDEKCRGSCLLPDGLGGETEIIPFEKWREAKYNGDTREETRFLCKGGRKTGDYMVISKTEVTSDVEKIRRGSGQGEDVIEVPVRNWIIKHSLVPLKSIVVDNRRNKDQSNSVRVKNVKRKRISRPPLRSKMRRLADMNSRLHCRELKLARLGGYTYQLHE